MVVWPREEVSNQKEVGMAATLAGFEDCPDGLAELRGVLANDHAQRNGF